MTNHASHALRLLRGLLLSATFAVGLSCAGPDFVARTLAEGGADAGGEDATLPTVIICSPCEDPTGTMDATAADAARDGDGSNGNAADGTLASDAMPTPEAGSEGSAEGGIDGGRCNASQSFGPPTAVAGINTAFNDYTMRLSPDETVAFFTSDRPYDAGSVSGLFQASRGTTAASFGAASPVSGITGNFADPSPTGDLLILFFNVNGGTGIIYSASRASTVNSFGSQAQVANVRGSGSDYTSYILPDGNALYFSSDRPGGMGAADIWRSAGSGASGLGTPVDVSGINSSADEWSIAVTPDDLTIYFGSTRTDGGAQGGYDIWTATRSSPTASFSSPTIIAAVNSPQDDVPTWISPDNCRLYLSSKRAGGMGGLDMYVAVRGP
jgi:hypothetical protein